MRGKNNTRKASREMYESIILAKLHADGFILVDEEKKTATLDCRRSAVVARYEESSYEDVRSIMERTAKGLRLAGYEVTTRWLDTTGGTDGESGE